MALILTLAPGKLGALPAGVHQIVRANESLLQEFVDEYFYRALSAFIRSQREYDHYLRRALGLPVAAQSPNSSLLNQGFPFLSPNWATIMVRTVYPGGAFQWHPETPVVEPGPRQDNEDSDMARSIEELKREVEALRRELKQREAHVK